MHDIAPQQECLRAAIALPVFPSCHRIDRHITRQDDLRSQQNSRNEPKRHQLRPKPLFYIRMHNIEPHYEHFANGCDVASFREFRLTGTPQDKNRGTNPNLRRLRTKLPVYKQIRDTEPQRERYPIAVTLPAPPRCRPIDRNAAGQGDFCSRKNLQNEPKYLPARRKSLEYIWMHDIEPHREQSPVATERPVFLSRGWVDLQMGGNGAHARGLQIQGTVPIATSWGGQPGGKAVERL